MATFHRSEFADALVRRLLEPDILASHDGIFLTGVRRIGKTTFLREDLIPKLQAEKALVIYVDLWSQDQSKSATKNVLNAVSSVLRDLGNPNKIKDFRVDLKVLSWTFEPEKVGRGDGVSLAEAFSELMRKINSHIVLIIDEIQETLKSESGRNLLKALKSARDAVNLRPDNPDETFLHIVGTGSHRSFVSAMASRSSQPFYGADRINFPLLGDAYIVWLTQQLDSTGWGIPEEVLKQGFGMLGCRPKVFSDVLRGMKDYNGSDPVGAFLAVCRNQARIDADEFLGEVRRSDRISKLLFTEIAKAGEEGCSNLFSTEFLEKLAALAGHNKPISTSSVQSKLSRMLKRDWIYPVSYGSYAVSDPQAAAVWVDNVEDYMSEL